MNASDCVYRFQLWLMKEMRCTEEEAKETNSEALKIPRDVRRQHERFKNIQEGIDHYDKLMKEPRKTELKFDQFLHKEITEVEEKNEDHPGCVG